MCFQTVHSSACVCEASVCVCVCACYVNVEPVCVCPGLGLSVPQVSGVCETDQSRLCSCLCSLWWGVWVDNRWHFANVCGGAVGQLLIEARCWNWFTHNLLNTERVKRAGNSNLLDKKRCLVSLTRCIFSEQRQVTPWAPRRSHRCKSRTVSVKGNLICIFLTVTTDLATRDTRWSELIFDSLNARTQLERETRTPDELCFYCLCIS